MNDELRMANTDIKPLGYGTRGTKGIVVLFILGLVGSACSSFVKEKETDIDTESYKKEIAEWQQKRNAYQVSETGWVNLAGLFWLKEGINTFGSAPDNDLVFPEGKIPPRAGYLLLKQSEIMIEGAPGVEFVIDGQPASKVMLAGQGLSRTVIEYGPLRWFVIKRGDQFGIRLRDLDHPLLKEFQGIECYPVNREWRIKGHVEWADSSRTIEITNVLGQTGPQRSVATLAFNYAGREYTLDALDEGGDEFFIIFGDDTNAIESYGAGRYLYVPVPENGSTEVIIDFNRAYNPPCAFTEFATCPLPPQQNVLPFAIPAGEKNYGTH